MPFKSAQALKQTGKYNAEAVSFSKKESYLKRVEDKLKNFKLVRMLDIDREDFYDINSGKRKRTFLDELDDELLREEEERNAIESCLMPPKTPGFQVSE